MMVATAAAPRASIGRRLSRSARSSQMPSGSTTCTARRGSGAEDCYKDTYAGAPTDGSAVTSSGCTFRVLRGGSWDNYPWLLRSASRVGVSPRPPGLLCRLRLSAGQNVRYLILSFWVEGVATGVPPQAVSQMPYYTALAVLNCRRRGVDSKGGERA